MNTEKVTLWYKVIKDDNGAVIKTVFNHLDDGWKYDLKPKPKHESFTNQKAWGKEDWVKEHKYMSNGCVHR